MGGCLGLEVSAICLRFLRYLSSPRGRQRKGEIMSSMRRERFVFPLFFVSSYLDEPSSPRSFDFHARSSQESLRTLSR